MPEGAGLHPFPDLCLVREQRCPSPSQSLCSIGQRGVSAASPIVPGESLATADMVTALLATGTVEPAMQKNCTQPRGELERLRLREQASAKWTSTILKDCNEVYILVGHAFVPDLRKQGQRKKNCILEVIFIIWDSHLL